MSKAGVKAEAHQQSLRASHWLEFQRTRQITTLLSQQVYPAPGHTLTVQVYSNMFEWICVCLRHLRRQPMPVPQA
jgi:hypothetical protein